MLQYIYLFYVFVKSHFATVTDSEPFSQSSILIWNCDNINIVCIMIHLAKLCYSLNYRIIFQTLDVWEIIKYYVIYTFRTVKSSFLYHHWQNSPFWAIGFLRRSCQIASGFHFFGIRKNNSFSEQVHQPCIQPWTCRNRSLYLCSLGMVA
jgi:hypothetical protein